MECIHLIHPWKYDAKGGQFITDAFTNNQGSLSILEIACTGPQTVCAYVNRFCSTWRRITSNPPVFWRFDTDALPLDRRVEATGAEDNPCHYDVHDLDDAALWTFFSLISNTLSMWAAGFFIRARHKLVGSPWGPAARFDGVVPSYKET